ncbi:hypothetical protein Tco_0687709 [Tanacetum coccineum]
MLLATKDEAGVHLDEEENDFMLDNAYGNNTLEELYAAVIMMARIQPTDEKSDAKPTYDVELLSEQALLQRELETCKELVKELENKLEQDLGYKEAYEELQNEMNLEKEQLLNEKEEIREELLKTQNETLKIKRETDHRVHQVIPQNYFINNDLEYPKGGSLSRKYSTSATKTKAATYEVQWIEDMVPNLWRFASNRKSKHDVYSRKRIITVTSLKIMKWYDYGHLDEIKVRREHQQLYKFKEGDFPRLRLQDIEDMLLLLVQQKLNNLTIAERYDLNVELRTMAGVDVDTLTMEQYLALSRENQAPGVVKPEIGGNVNFECKSRMLNLRKDLSQTRDCASKRSKQVERSDMENLDIQRLLTWENNGEKFLLDTWILH